MSQLSYLFVFGVKGKEVELAVSVGEKIDFVSYPHGVCVIASALWLRNLLHQPS